MFISLDDHDKKTLREYYADYRATMGGNIGTFLFETLDDFLKNLDGEQNIHGDYIGSFDWRYFPIEVTQSRNMPQVSVDYLHEIIFGCIRIIEYVINSQFEPSQYS